MRVATFRSRRQSDRRDPPKLVYQFLIVLSGTNPLVWRRIQVPQSYSFWDLHVAIQDAMGWEDRHLHEFRLFDDQAKQLVSIGIPTDMTPGDRPVVPGWTVAISTYIESRACHGLPTLYAYDFGDDWEHVLVHEGGQPIKRSVKYPRCVAGARRCPPEDCGGVHGYASCSRSLRTPKIPNTLRCANGSVRPTTRTPSSRAVSSSMIPNSAGRPPSNARRRSP